MIIAAVVAGALLVIGAGGTTAFLVVRSNHRANDVAAADRSAAAFDKAVSHYRSKVSSAISSSDPDDALKMQAGVQSSVDDVPKLGAAPAWGRTHSKAYVKARAAEKTLKAPYRQLSRALDEAVVGQPFIDAGRKALNVHPGDFITERLLPNGARVRAVLIPGYKKALARFSKVEVPQGQASVARKIKKELQETIDEATQVAANLDLGRGGLINPQKEYVSASKALIAYDTSLRKRLNDAMDIATGGVNDDQVDT